MRSSPESDLSQKQSWEWLNSSRGGEFRDLLSRRFGKKFPHWHETSLREFVETVKTRRANGEQFIGAMKLLNDIHPAALDLLLRYGRDYVPYEWSTFPPEPQPRQCFGNTWILAHLATEDPVAWSIDPLPRLYVEGIAYASVGRPMLHAWNTHSVDSHVAIDWTNYCLSRWSRYLGIPLSLQETLELCLMKRTRPDLIGSILHKEYLTDRMLDRLISILESQRK
jgi:hypothetical protein